VNLNNPIFIKTIITSVVLLISFVIYRLLLRFLHKRIQDVQKFYNTKKAITYAYFIVSVIIGISIWFEGLSNLSTYIGLLSAGIAIALKDPISNIAAFIFIILRKPFEVGDRVEINGNAGDVIDQRVFMFTLMEIGNWVHADQSTGRIIHVPNHVIFTHPLANFTKGFSHIWNEIEVLITFESDWKKAKLILNDISNKYAKHLSDSAERHLKEAAKKFMIKYNNLTPIVYTRVESDGIKLTLRYLTDPRNRRSSSEVIWEQILTQFEKEPSINLAYRTLRIIHPEGE
jgi:small-conductance mechanosensitive channel